MRIPVELADALKTDRFEKLLEGLRRALVRRPVPVDAPERAVEAIEAAIRASGSYAVPVMHGGDLVVFVPKSISFGKLSHLAACALFDGVAAVIEAEIGIPADRLLQETEKAA